MDDASREPTGQAMTDPSADATADPAAPPDGAVLSMAAVFPTGKLGDAVGFLGAVLGIEPTFVDGERWAQFDLNGSRLSLAAGAESSGRPRVMVKVAGLEAVAARLRAAGWDVAGPVAGPHERRVSVTGPDGWDAVLYEPLGRS